MSFRFTAQAPVVARAAIYDAAGRRVIPLGARTVSGSGAFSWDGRDASGSLVPSGIYFLHVSAGGESHVRRFVRMH
jgi:flagellar hook assembly protein FlgD